MEALGADPEFSAITVHEWIEHHIDHLTGRCKYTLYDYRSYLENGIETGCWVICRCLRCPETTSRDGCRAMRNAAEDQSFQTEDFRQVIERLNAPK